MRVLYLLHDSTLSGSTISFLNMLYGLLHKGVKPLVVIPSYNDDLIAILNSYGVEYRIVEMPFEIYPPINSLISLVKFPVKLARLVNKISRSLNLLSNIISEFRPVLIHSNSGVIHSGYKLSRKYNIPHIWHIREYQDIGYNWKIFPSKSIFKQYLKYSHTITITKDLLNHFGLTGNENSSCIYNGILNANETRNISIKEKYFLIVGRISPEKKIEDAILAFNSFHRIFPHYKLRIIGASDISYLNSLKQICVLNNLNDVVDFYGFKNKAFILDQMSNAKALIVPSEFEGFGRMTAEALFMGCPVIGKNSGGTKEIIDNAGGGIYYTSINSLVQILCDFAENNVKFDMPAVQEFVVNNFTIEANIERIYKLYNHIIHRV